MNYADFIKWIDESGIDQKYKNALHITKLVNPLEYLDTVRKVLKRMVEDGVVLQYKKFSLGEVYERLDPDRVTGKKFAASIPAEFLLANPVQQRREILASQAFVPDESSKKEKEEKEEDIPLVLKISGEPEEGEPVVMVSEDEESEDQIVDMIPVAIEPPSLEDARKKALHLLLRLQRLPDAAAMNEVTDDIANFYRAALELNQSIPGGAGRPVEFANNLMSALPPHVSLYSDAIVSQLEKIYSLYENDADAGQFCHFLYELSCAIPTKKNELGGLEDESSKRKLLLGVSQAWVEIVNENKRWNEERKQAGEISENKQKCDRLYDACTGYMKHLGRQMYEGLRDGDFELCKTLVYRDEADNKLKFKLNELMDIVDRNGTNIKMLRANDKGFDMAIQKYQAVKAMRSTLEGNQTSSEKLQAFKNNFDGNRHIIEQRRDSGAIKFLKVLATVFTLGIAAAAGLWKVKGRQFTDDISKQLPNDNKPGGNKNK